MESSQDTQREVLTRTREAIPNPSTRHDSDGNTSSLSHQRVRTYWAQSLVLFNIYGIPLSSGIWLEYTYTTLLPTTSLTLISLVYASHFFFLFAAIPLTRWLYTRLPTRHQTLLLLTIAILSCARTGLIVSHAYPALLICNALTGTGLSALGTFHTLRLASHYRNNIGLASSYSTAGGFLGSIIHTVLTWSLLRRDLHTIAHGLTLAIFFLTTLPATYLSRPCPPTILHPPRPRDRRRNISRLALTFGLAQLGITLLLIPLYTPLLLSRILHPDAAVYTLLAAFITATLTAPLAARHSRAGSHGSNASTRLIALGGLLSASGVTMFTFSPVLWACITGGAVFGVGLSVVVGVAGRVVGGMRERWGEVFAGVLGVGVLVGILGVAAVVEGRGDGIVVVSWVVGGGLIGGVGLVVVGGVRKRRGRGM